MHKSYFYDNMSKTKKLFLLDAYALIYRAYFAFIKNPRINTKGINTSAIFGFANTLIEVIQKENPSHLAVVFDTKEPTKRHDSYPEYKANREKMPEDLQKSLPYIDKFLEALNITKLFKPGYEADDIIGTIAKKAEKEGFNVYMMTSDKDFAQLVSENIFMYRPASKWRGQEIWGPAEVLDKFKIQDVNQVIDFLGMMGDAIDNIPGLPGVGKKTAEILKKKKINNLFDLLWRLPQSYTDRIQKNTINELQIGKIHTLRVLVKKYSFPRIRNLPKKVMCEDSTGKIDCVFFNSYEGYIKKILPLNEKVTISGKISYFNKKYQITNPTYVSKDSTLIQKIHTKYSLTEGISEKIYNKIIDQTLKKLPILPEWLDNKILKNTLQFVNILPIFKP